MEPWEALDVDDSDLPSLLRPCKQTRLHHHISQTPTTTAAAASAVPSQPQQQASQPITQRQSLSKQQEEKRSSQDYSHPKNNPTRLIPGPAGPVQAAMLRKAWDREVHGFDESTPIPTQEYIRKAVENATPEFDHDFRANAWLCALQFLGVLDGVVPGTPLGSIKKWVNAGKVDKVVAIIKSCTPNGLGGLMVTLKDPTGTVGASIHHKVLVESEYGKEISLGSVLILQKVAVFAPSQSAYYLNITLSNLVKVFSKCIGPPPEQHCPANAVRCSTPNIGYCGKAIRPETTPTLGRGTVKEILEDTSRCRDKRPIVQRDREAGKESLLPRSFECQDKVSLSQGVAVERGVLTSRQEGAEVVFNDTNVECNEGFMAEKSNLPKEGNLQGSILRSSAAINSIKEPASANEIHKQTQPLISKNSLTQWTDEQLQELFASDGEDDDTMF